MSQITLVVCMFCGTCFERMRRNSKAEYAGYSARQSYEFGHRRQQDR